MAGLGFAMVGRAPFRCRPLGLLLLLLLLLGLSSAAADQQITTVGGYTVDFVGASGQMKLSPPGSPDFIQLKLDKLLELDEEGRAVRRVNNFASQDFAWVVSPGNRVNATVANLTSVLEVGSGAGSFRALFQVVAELYPSDATVANGDEAVFVPKDHLKFTLRISGWQFEAPSNRLQFGYQVLTPGSAKPSKQDATDPFGKKLPKYSFGMSKASLVTQSTAVVDGVNRAINSSVYESGSKVGVEWQFPSFSQSLVYDPTIGFTSASMAPPVLSAITFALAVAIALLAPRGI